MRPILQLHNLNLKYPSKTVLRDLNWTINRGENWLLSGASGSGKTSLAKIIAGLTNAEGQVEIHFDPTSALPAQVFFVESWYQFKNIEGVANFYYQQRYNHQQAKETLTVGAELLLFGQENQLHFAAAEIIMEALGLLPLRNSQLIQLSSGEHKKLQLVKAIWLKPQLLMIDQAYTGLDKLSRQQLNLLLDQIVAEGVQLILIGNDHDLPKAIDHYALLNEGKLEQVKAIPANLTANQNQGKVPDFLAVAPNYTSHNLVKMVNVNISYGEKQVLKNINWEVNAGEKWLLQGHNGSGKSTLLSLVNGDHPQSYANTIYLFGQKRGSGESIWDIKQHIGLISPEFHWYFDTSSTVWQSIASGFFDSVGLFHELGYEKSKQVNELIEYFGLTADKNELLSKLPLGKQRLVLLGRTIIKNPELLILDEPCQGLDQAQTQHFNQLVDELCNNGMTLIYVGHFETQLPSCLSHQLQLHQGETVDPIKIDTTQKELVE